MTEIFEIGDEVCVSGFGGLRIGIVKSKRFPMTGCFGSVWNGYVIEIEGSEKPVQDFYLTKIVR